MRYFLACALALSIAPLATAKIQLDFFSDPGQFGGRIIFDLPTDNTDLQLGTHPFESFTLHSSFDPQIFVLDQTPPSPLVAGLTVSNHTDVNSLFGVGNGVGDYFGVLGASNEASGKGGMGLWLYAPDLFPNNHPITGADLTTALLNHSFTSGGGAIYGWPDGASPPPTHPLAYFVISSYHATIVPEPCTLAGLALVAPLAMRRHRASRARA